MSQPTGNPNGHGHGHEEHSTDEQLRLAFRHLRRPNSWPTTFEAAMADPTFALCLRAMARNLGRPKWQASPVAPSLPAAPVPPTPTAPPARTPTPAPPPPPRTKHKAPRKAGVDLKRRAANDLDD
jgi:hypothetical protein